MQVIENVARMATDPPVDPLINNAGYFYAGEPESVLKGTLNFAEQAKQARLLVHTLTCLPTNNVCSFTSFCTIACSPTHLLSLIAYKLNFTVLVQQPTNSHRVSNPWRAVLTHLLTHKLSVAEPNTAVVFPPICNGYRTHQHQSTRIQLC